jgi:hypothetical protein
MDYSKSGIKANEDATKKYETQLPLLQMKQGPNVH